MNLSNNYLLKYCRTLKNIIANGSKKLKQIPERKGLPLIGTSLAILANGSAPKLHLHIDNGHKILGPIFKENMGATSAIFISDPYLMRQVFEVEGKHPKHFLPQPWIIFNELHNCKRGLFFMDGEEWYLHRRLMNKHFLRSDVISDLKCVHQEIVKYLIKRWKNYDGKEISELEHEFYRHSISFLIGSLTGSSYIKYIDSYDKDVEKLASMFSSIFATTAYLNGKPIKLMAKFSAPGWKQFETAVQSSLEACYEVVDKIVKNRSQDGLMDKMLNENLPRSSVVAIVADLILAAGDTTAITSQWSLYLLSGHKYVQQALLKGEIDVKNVVKETLRMYPPAIFISRVMPEDTNVSGYILSKGEMVLLSLFSAGRNNNIYPSANLFKPERWVRSDVGKETEGVVDRRAYIPFAMGARACIGKNLALAQLHYTLSEIVSEYDMELQEEVEMRLRLVPVPLNPIKIKIKSRK